VPQTMGQVCIKSARQETTPADSSKANPVCSAQVQLHVAPGTTKANSRSVPKVDVSAEINGAVDIESEGGQKAEGTTPVQLKALVDKLQQDNATLRSQVDNYQKKLGRQTQEMENTSSCQDCETLKIKYGHLKIVTESLKHRISDLATGESGATHLSVAAEHIEVRVCERCYDLCRSCMHEQLK
jgi:hypothetical protein